MTEPRNRGEESRSLGRRLAACYELPDYPGRNHALEGLRGVGAFLVFAAHYHGLFSAYMAPTSTGFAFSQFFWLTGLTAVSVFFLLSGYFIYGLLIRRTQPFGKFMARRIERLYPTFLVVFALYLLLSWVFPHQSKIPDGIGAGALHVAQNLIMMPGVFDIEPIITPAWTLSYEMAFYLAIPLLVGLTRMRSWSAQGRCAFFVAGTFLTLWLVYPDRIQHVRVLLFAAGFLVYEFCQTPAIAARFTRRFELAALIAFVMAFILHYLFLYQPGYFRFLPGFDAFYPAYLVLAECIAFIPFVTYCGVLPDGWIARMLRWTPLRSLGNMSYSFYLFHGLVLKGVLLVAAAVWPLDGDSPWVFTALAPLSFVAALASSTVLFVLVEKRYSILTKTAH